MARVKAPALASRLEFERMVDEVARFTVLLREAEAERDASIQIARDLHAPKCAALASELKVHVLAAEKYATEHRAELLPGKSKTAETPLAMWGFRTGMPQLKLLSKWTWEKVLEKLDGSIWGGFIRVKREVDKAGILAAATKRGDSSFTEYGTPLSDFGLKVAQEETFFVEAKDKGEGKPA
jgi:phage host-nuclease inhibitor protein Gam